MSSDSDGEYSYTNSVSVLKALTKKNTSLNSDIDDSSNRSLFKNSDFESPSPVKKNVTRNRSKCTSDNEIIILESSKGVRRRKTEDTTIDLDSIDDELTLKDSLNDDLTLRGSLNVDLTLNDDLTLKDLQNDSCVIVDEEANLTPVDIISTIDGILQPKTGAKKRGGKKKTPGKRQTRQSNRLKTPTKRQTRQSGGVKNKKSTVLEPVDVCIIEDIPDIDEVNYDITVKIHWKSQYVEKIKMKRFDKFAKVFQHFSEKENVPENRLLFTLNENVISKTDTPNQLNLTVASIIEGGILSDQLLANSSNRKRTIEFKVQLKDRKHPLLISIKPEDKMEVLMYQCAEELEVPIKKLKFCFDGDVIKPHYTPNDLDLEGGEIIDCIKKII